MISQDRLSWLLAGAGVAGLAAAVAASPADAEAAASQDWSPFVSVTGLLLIGLVANDDGLFAAAGHQLALVARSRPALFAGAAVIIGLATATLNLDTSVAFLTPVLGGSGYADRAPVFAPMTWHFRMPARCRHLRAFMSPSSAVSLSLHRRELTRTGARPARARRPALGVGRSRPPSAEVVGCTGWRTGGRTARNRRLHHAAAAVCFRACQAVRCFRRHLAWSAEPTPQALARVSVAR